MECSNNTWMELNKKGVDNSLLVKPLIKRTLPIFTLCNHKLFGAYLKSDIHCEFTVYDA